MRYLISKIVKSSNNDFSRRFSIRIFVLDSNKESSYFFIPVIQVTLCIYYLIAMAVIF